MKLTFKDNAKSTSESLGVSEESLTALSEVVKGMMHGEFVGITHSETIKDLLDRFDKEELAIMLQMTAFIHYNVEEFRNFRSMLSRLSSKESNNEDDDPLSDMLNMLSSCDLIEQKDSGVNLGDVLGSKGVLKGKDGGSETANGNEED